MIPIFWFGSNGRSSCAGANMLNEMFDRYECDHSPGAVEGQAVIVVHGQNCPAEQAKWISEAAAGMESVIFIVLGDEHGTFPVADLTHPRSKLWVQLARPEVKADRYLIQGYPAGTKYYPHNRDFNWFFSGQVTHARREACARQLWIQQKRRADGHLLQTKSFGAGLIQVDYLKLMSRAKVAPCPAGPATPDTFRVWEALECGCVPVVDAVSLDPRTRGYWWNTLGPHPLPIVEEWDEFPVVLSKILADWEMMSEGVGAWWEEYKREFWGWLGKDLEELHESRQSV